MFKHGLNVIIPRLSSALRPPAWASHRPPARASPRPLVNYGSIMTVAMHIMTVAMESHVFRINPRVTYPPQRPRLLSDVNVFGGLFLCWSTL